MRKAEITQTVSTRKWLQVCQNSTS